jgi:hypothetical protein
MILDGRRGHHGVDLHRRADRRAALSRAALDCEEKIVYERGIHRRPERGTTSRLRQLRGTRPRHSCPDVQ